MTNKEIEIGTYQRDVMVGKYGFERYYEKKVTKSANYTVLDADSGMIIEVDTADVVITLPATILGHTITIRNMLANGGGKISISPNSSDKIMGIGLSAQDNKDLINTGATHMFRDEVTLLGDGTDGWRVQACTGVWEREA